MDMLMTDESDPLLALHTKIATANSPLEYLRAWANYMLFVDPRSHEGLMAKEAATEMKRMQAELEMLRGKSIYGD